MKFIFTLILVITFTLPYVVYAGVFREDFDDGKANDWIVASGSWKAEKGEYVQEEIVGKQGGEARNRASAYAVGDKAWKDYTFEVKIKPISASNYAGVMFRVSSIDGGADGNTFGRSTYYYWLIGVGGTYSKIWQSPSGKALEENPGQTLAAGKWNEVKMEMKGQNVKLYLNGKKEKDFDFPKEFHISHGGIALATYNASAAFDEVRVEGEGIGLAVDSKEKLPITWGKIKAGR